MLFAAFLDEIFWKHFVYLVLTAGHRVVEVRRGSGVSGELN